MPVQCYACDLTAVAECPRCGSLFCDEHGEALCSRCMDPARALPSYWVYRGSLLALMAGSVVAAWLLVFPPEDAGSGGRPPASIASVLGDGAVSPTPPPAAAVPRVATAEARPAVAAEPTPTATRTPTPAPTATPTAAAPTPRPEVEYTVRPGDTLFDIAGRFLEPGGDHQELVDRIVELNGIADPSNIQPGQVITIPAQ